MQLDRKVLRETLAQYRAWNEAKFAHQVLTRRQETPEEKWQAYQDLYAFGCQIKSTSSYWEQVLAMEEWAAYYTRIERCEEWRRQHGKTA